MRFATCDPTHRYLRPDAYRWMTPEVLQSLYPEYHRSLQPKPLDRKYRAEPPVVSASERAEAQRNETARLRAISLIRAAQIQIAMIRHLLALQRKYDPEQPRVPRANPEGGQWESLWSRQHLAGLFPRIPSQRPPTAKEYHAIVKAVAVALAQAGIAAPDYIKENSWLYQAYPYINAYLDRPRSLAELHDLVSTPEKDTTFTILSSKPRRSRLVSQEG